MMRWTRLSVVTIFSFLFVVSGAVFKKSVALSLCGILIFNAVTCQAYFGNTSRANAALSPGNNGIEQALPNASREQEVADICLFGICAPVDLPDPIEDVIEGELDDAAKDQLRSLLADEIPIRGSDHEFYDSVAILPGDAFTPQLLPLSALSPDTPIPPGDYEIPVHFYCTKVYSFDGRGNRFPLARLDGQMSDVLSALYTRASYDSTVLTNDIQTLAWAIQTGMSYDELPDSQQALVDRLIPDYRDRMERSLVDRLTGIVNDVSRISGNRLPGVNQILDDLGPVGDVAGSLLQAREQILQTNYSYQALAQEFAPQQDAFLDGGTEETPWSKTRENVYMRFIAPNGAMDNGTVQVRIVDNSSSQLNLDNSPVLVASLPPDDGISPSSTDSVRAGDLTQDITSSVGVPEASGTQAITASQESKPCPDLPEFSLGDHPYLFSDNPSEDERYKDDYHDYTVTSTICSTSNPQCDEHKIFEIMISQRRFVAPYITHDQRSPVQHCAKNILSGAGDDPVVTLVNEFNYSVTNYTLEGHVFHPGRIVRAIIREDGYIKVRTRGEGTGDFLGVGAEINQWRGPDIFENLDEMLIEHVNSSIGR